MRIHVAAPVVRLTLGVLSIVFGIGLSAARAQDTSGAKHRWQFEVGSFTGTNQTAASNLHLKQPSTNTDATIEDIHWQAQPFKGSAYYGYRVLAWTPKAPRLGLMLDFVHHKAYAKVDQSKRIVGTFNGEAVDEVAPIDERVQRFQVTNGINLITLGVLYRGAAQVSPGFAEGRIQPYIGGGPSYMVLVPINTVSGENNTKKREWDGLAYSILGGVRYGLTSHLSLMLEARYDRVNANVNLAHNGFGETDFKTVHESGGLTYRF